MTCLLIHITDHTTRHGEVSFDAFGFAGRAPAGNMKRSSCIGWTKWDCTGATTPQPFNYARKDQLYSNSFSCPQQGDVPGYAGGVDVGLETDLDGSMILGWSVVGTLLHPTQEVEFYFGLNTTISGTLDISANLNVRVVCPRLRLEMAANSHTVSGYSILRTSNSPRYSSHTRGRNPRRGEHRSSIQSLRRSRRDTQCARQHERWHRIRSHRREAVLPGHNWTKRELQPGRIQ